ncbi:hypothetical protein L1765_07880 [Microaerobacter geothermalis]|uniref:hypothetical protein n=1 Tax=Microaerobacter geothermalis TaxID=674972 RepID=UPI001F40C76B|nr:hypothetical protein [Microaerobacter geothermalis]MCF6093888.1 hypothetical protein [Microaerobacter geothermalis]
MSRSYTYFYFDLKLKSPSETALETGLDRYAEDTYMAAEFFNQRFQGIKKITILEVEGIAVRLMLVYERSTPEKVTAKELTVFSRYLYNERGWDKFTKEPTKLFIPTKIVPMEWHEAHFTITADFERDPDDELIQRYPSLWPDWADFGFEPEDDVVVSCEEDDDLSSYEEELSDEQLIAVLNSILATQNMGSHKAKEAKKSVIKQIKKLITPWAIYG